nr:hypothetical protein GCM10025699_69990 [Microbacterium flavescens]
MVVERLGDGVEQLGSLRVRSTAPGDARLDGAGDDLLESAVPGHPGRVDPLETQVGGPGRREHASAPRAGVLVRRVGVGSTREPRPSRRGGPGRLGPVESAGCALGVVDQLDRPEVGPTFALEVARIAAELDGRADGPRAAEPADHAADHHVELVGRRHGRVEGEAAHLGRDGGGLGRGQTVDGLDGDEMRHRAPLGDAPGVGEVEEVVARDADVHDLGVGRSQRVIDQALERRVGRDPRREGDGTPRMAGRVDGLGVEIRPLTRRTRMGAPPVSTRFRAQSVSSSSEDSASGR